MKPAVIEAQGLSLQIGNRALVKNIHWTIRQGEHWLIFGQNGSGKTSLLNLLSANRTPTAGELRLFGQRVDQPNALNLGRRIGYVSGSFYEKYYRHEAILDIVLSGKTGALGPSLALTDQDVRLAKRLLRAFGLGKVTGHPFQLLSNGQRQSVLMARALFAQPDILIMDEPTAGLDIYSRNYLLQIIQELAQTSALTLLFVTHYVEEILPEFEHSLLLRDGQAFASGKSRDIFCSETLSQFIRHPVTVTWSDNRPQVTMRVDTPAKTWVEEGLFPAQ